MGQSKNVPLALLACRLSDAPGYGTARPLFLYNADEGLAAPCLATDDCLTGIESHNPRLYHNSTLVLYLFASHFCHYFVPVQYAVIVFILGPLVASQVFYGHTIFRQHIRVSRSNPTKFCRGQTCKVRGLFSTGQTLPQLL